MNVLLIYFSQTGGTAKITRKIQESILNGDNICDIIELKEADNIIW